MSNSNKVTVDQAVLDNIEKTFGNFRPHLTFYRIRFNGKFIVTKNGKYYWKTVGNAKSALLYHFEHVTACRIGGTNHTNLPFLPRIDPTYGGINSSILKGFVRQLENEGFIEYVPVTLGCDTTTTVLPVTT